jgi:integrase
MDDAVTPTAPAKVRAKAFMAPFNFTDKALAKLPPPPPGRKEYQITDTGMPGLGVRRFAASKRFVHLYAQPDGRRACDTIGKFPSMTTATARLQIQARVTDRQRGVDHHAKKAEARKERKNPTHTLTFGGVIDRFEAARMRHSRGGYVENFVAMLRAKYAPLLKRSWASLTTEDMESGWDALLDRPAAADALYGHARRLANWATSKKGLKLKHNPVREAAPPDVKMKPRQRALSGLEARLVWEACGELALMPGTFVRFLLGTGLRYMEAAQLTWDMFTPDLSELVIPSVLMKGGKNGHMVVVPSTLRKLLAELPRYTHADFVFTDGQLRRNKRRTEPAAAAITGSSALKKKLDEALAGRIKEHFQFHDFRRSAVTWMAANGIDSIVADKSLSHVSGGAKLSPVGLIYQKFEFLPQRGEAIERWVRFLAGETKEASSPAHPAVEPPTIDATAEHVAEFEPDKPELEPRSEQQKLKQVTFESLAEGEDFDFWRLPTVRRAFAYQDLMLTILSDPKVCAANVYLSGQALSPEFEDTYGSGAYGKAFLELARLRARQVLTPRPLVKAKDIEADRDHWTKELEQYRAAAATDWADAKRARTEADQARSLGREEYAVEAEQLAAFAESNARQNEEAVTVWEQMLRVIPTTNDPRVARNLSLAERISGKAHAVGAFEEMGRLIKEIWGWPHDKAALAYANALPGFKVTPDMGKWRRKAAGYRRKSARSENANVFKKAAGRG